MNYRHGSRENLVICDKIAYDSVIVTQYNKTISGVSKFGCDKLVVCYKAMVPCYNKTLKHFNFLK